MSDERRMEVKVLNENRKFKQIPEPVKHPTHFDPLKPAPQVPQPAPQAPQQASRTPADPKKGK